MSSRHSGRTGLALTALALALVLLVPLAFAGCGGGGGTTATTSSSATTAGAGGVSGADLYAAACAGCHGDDGTAGARDIGALEVDSIMEAVRDGVGSMPEYSGRYSEEEIRAISEYAATLD